MWGHHLYLSADALFPVHAFAPPGVIKVAKQMKEVVAIVGLGYVGLPLAVEFGKKFDTIGYDLSATKIDSYRRFCDPDGRGIERESARGYSIDCLPAIPPT